MKRLFTLLWLMLAGSLATSHGAIWFVTPDGSAAAAGSSWADALAQPAQAAVNARAGDEIWVAAGRYLGGTVNLVPGIRLLGGFAGQETTAADRSTNAALTVLETTNDLPVLSVVGDSSGAVVQIAGFTLQAGAAAEAIGRGLEASNAAVEVDQCVFRRFKAKTSSDSPGSAIAAQGGSLRVTGSTFADNQTATNGYAAAVGCISVSPVEIRGSEFLRNRAGAASALELNRCVGTVTGCLFARNSVADEGIPGTIELYRSEVALTRNRFLFNSGGAGSAVFIFEFRESVAETNVVAFNLFAGNVANDSAGLFPAGSVSYRNAGRIQVLNNTFAGEVSRRLPNRIASSGPLAGTARSVQVVNNLFLAHHKGDQFETLPDTRRNVFLDLGESLRVRRYQLGRPEGWADDEVVGGLNALDFNLQPTAVSRGFGDPSVVPPGALDLAGRSAVHPDGTVDAGALSFDPDYAAPAPPKVVHLHPGGDDHATGDSWTNAVQTFAEALRRVATTGPTELWLAAGSFAGGCGPEGLPPGVALRGSFAGHETNRLQRGRELTTELNASQTNVLVSLNRNGRWNEIEGLVLNGAGGPVGPATLGGFAATSSWPHIHHCRFENHRGEGYAIALYSEGGIIEDCEFVRNFRDLGTNRTQRTFESIIHVSGSGPPAIFRRNVVWQNTNFVSSRAVAWFGKPCRVEYNIWLSNHAGSGTEGLITYYADGPLAVGLPYGFWHNTLIGNKGASSLFKMTFPPRSPIQFSANLVAHNEGQVEVYPPFVTARDNLLFDNGPVTPAYALPTNLNLFLDPKLAADGWHLRADSPARDAVTVPGVEGFTMDMDGEGAWLGRAPDIGADEFLPDHPLARTVAGAVVTGSATPATLAGTFRDWEDTCPDCHTRSFVRDADGIRLELVANEVCPAIACTDQLRPVDYPFDFGRVTPGVTPLLIQAAGQPLRTVSLWVRPPLEGFLRITRPADQTILSVDGHPGVPLRLEGTTNFVDWQSIESIQVTPFIQARPDEPWFFRTLAR